MPSRNRASIISPFGVHDSISSIKSNNAPALVTSGSSKKSRSKKSTRSARVSHTSTSTSGRSSSKRSTTSGSSGTRSAISSASPRNHRAAAAASTEGSTSSASGSPAPSVSSAPCSAEPAAASSRSTVSPTSDTSETASDTTSSPEASAGSPSNLAFNQEVQPAVSETPEDSLDEADSPAAPSAREDETGAGPTCTSESRAQSAATSVFPSKTQPSLPRFNSHAPSPLPKDSEITRPSASSNTMRTAASPAKATWDGASPSRDSAAISSPLEKTRRVSPSLATSSADQATEPVAMLPAPKPIR